MLRISTRLATLFLFCGLPAFGATLTVTSLNDSGAGSLRAAMTAAAAGDTITFQAGLTGTITLQSALPTITQNLTIQGPGASTITVSGNNGVFQVFVSSATLSLSGLTIANAYFIASPPVSGGGISNDGTLTVTNCILSGNTAVEPGGGLGGGGIFNSSNGTATVTNSSFSGNSAGPQQGGAIQNFGTMTVTGSTFSGNFGATGGAIHNVGTLTVTNSTFSGNSATQIGGGIYNNIGTLTVTNSTFSGNSAATGGAIHSAGTLTVTNSTLSGNTANTGGGIENALVGVGTLTLTNSTLSGNSGGAILNNATATLKGTLLSHGSTGTDCSGSGVITSQGFNLADDSSCAASFNQTGDINNTAAQLDPAGLKNNGGPTQTIALQFGSPAANAIPLVSCFVLTDQRGVVRPQGSGCDIGATELVLSPTPVPVLSPLTLVVLTLLLVLFGTMAIRRQRRVA